MTNARLLVREEVLFAPYVSAYETYHCSTDGV